MVVTLPSLLLQWLYVLFVLVYMIHFGSVALPCLYYYQVINSLSMLLCLHVGIRYLPWCRHGNIHCLRLCFHGDSHCPTTKSTAVTPEEKRAAEIAGRQADVGYGEFLPNGKLP